MNLNEKVTFLISFSLFVASAYLFGFWGSFNINILELGGFSDIVKLAFYPLLKSLAFLFIGELTGNLLGYPFLMMKESESLGNQPPVSVERTRKFAEKYWIIICLFLLIIIFSLIYFTNYSYKWLQISFFLTLFLVFFSHNRYFRNLLDSHSINYSFLTFIIYLVYMSFSYGKIDANLIKDGAYDRVVDVPRSKLNLYSSLEKPVVYLGRVNEIDILYETKTGQVVLSKQPDDNPLFIINRKK